MTDFIRNPSFTDYKESVRVASAGVSVDLSIPPPAIDGVTLNYGDRVLLKDQGIPEDNGIYLWSANAPVLERAPGGIDHQITSGMMVIVEEGDVNADKVFMLTTDDPIETGVTPLVFEEFGGDGGDSDTLAGEAPAFYLDRANHTGTQALVTISDAGSMAAEDVADYVAAAGDTMTGALILNADPVAALGAATKQYVDTGLSGKEDSLGFTPENTANKGVAGGYASLDGSGKLPASELTVSAMEYKGAWNANTNSPALADGVGSAGDLYRVSVAGTQDLGSGSITFAIGDSILYSGSVWEKIDNTDSVVSVAGKTGIVTLQEADITDLGSYVSTTGDTMTGVLQMEQDIYMNSPRTIIWPNASSSHFALNVYSGSGSNFVLKGDGRMEWGSGSGATDTVLQRTAAGILSMGAGDKLQQNEAPTAGDDLTNKTYVDGAIGAIDLSPYVEKAGDTMTGSLKMDTSVSPGSRAIWFDDGVLPTILQQVSPGVVRFTSGKLQQNFAPTVDDDMANKKYVDDSIAGGGGGNVADGTADGQLAVWNNVAGEYQPVSTTVMEFTGSNDLELQEEVRANKGGNDVVIGDISGANRAGIAFNSGAASLYELGGNLRSDDNLSVLDLEVRGTLNGITSTGGLGLYISNTTTNGIVFASRLSSPSAQNTFVIRGDGDHEWSDGSSVADVSLRRSGAGQLNMDQGNLFVGTLSGTNLYAQMGAGNVQIQRADEAFYRARLSETTLAFQRGSDGANDSAIVHSPTTGRLTVTSAGDFWVNTDMWVQDNNNLWIGDAAGNSTGGVKHRGTALATTTAFSAKVNGDGVDRIVVQGDGQINFGDGAVAQDVNLYRASADVLKTDDRIEAVDSITIKTKAGVPVDGDFAQTPPDGTLVLDTTGPTLYARSGGTWQAV